MNGILDNQTSGNDWGIPIQAMLHEQLHEQMGNVPESPVTASQRSFIYDIEAQMQHFQSEYQAAIAEVRKLYVLPTDSSVLDFLNDHRALPQILIDAAPQLKRYFSNVVFTLRVSSDDYGWQNLYADAMWTGDARDAVRLLDQFEDDWWISNSRPAQGSLIFTYRLV